MRGIVPIIIPSLDPKESFFELLKELQSLKQPIIIINDGSSKESDYIFDKAREFIVNDKLDKIISYPVNKGKGFALKNGFKYVLENIPQAIGVVTIDCDGQHKLKDIKKVINLLQQNPEAIILGARDFDLDEIPIKSKLGNKITKCVLSYFLNIKLKDTQTGLRGISIKHISEMQNIKYNRFEFETEVLIRFHQHIKEVDIETVYDSITNHSTHFNPIKDSLSIYYVIFRQFFKYIISSVSSFFLDIGLFYVFSIILKGIIPFTYVFISTYMARIISAFFNYILNKHIVFQAKESRNSFIKYCLLCFVQASISGVFVTIASYFTANIVASKIITDSILFLLSYLIQKHYIFIK